MEKSDDLQRHVIEEPLDPSADREVSAADAPRPPVVHPASKRDRKIADRWERAGREKVIGKLTEVNRQAMDRATGRARRTQHRKHHGCVSATFRVLDDIPADLRHGLFKDAGEYPAWIRFSNGTGDDDRKRDSHGFAIKVLEVGGAKALPEQRNEQAQDFVLADHETFPSGSPLVLILLSRMLSGTNSTKMVTLFRLAFFHPRSFWRSMQPLKKTSSLLDISYFSAMPYELGPHAVKYVVQPREGVRPGKGVRTSDGLGEELRSRLAKKDANIIFDFGVDVRVDPEAQPLEDPSVPWSAAAGHRREWLAEIVIPGPDSLSANGFAENLAFSPWHARTEHQPIGFLAEARRDVYRSLARHRHQRNEITPIQTSEAPEEYADGRPTTFGSLYWDAPRLTWRERLNKRFKERLASVAGTSPFLIRLINQIGPTQRAANASAINYFASQTTHRPLPLSLWRAKDPIDRNDPKSYGARVSWPGLVERSFTGRHLPPVSEAEVANLPSLSEVRRLFDPGGPPAASDRTSALFSFFAQWLTDSFLRTHPDDRRCNTSTHELDLCQIYGLGEEATRLLRTQRDGRLHSRLLNTGEEFPAFLVDPVTLAVHKEFANIAFDPIYATSFAQSEPPHGRARDLRKLLRDAPGFPKWAVAADRWRKFYAGGLERGNSTIIYSALNTLFLREHNRLAAELKKRYSTDDDDWLFETARSINIIKYIKIIIEDYINHILGSEHKLRLAQGIADRCTWYRTNRITLEFNLLYRWHALVPNEFRLDQRTLPDREFRFNNALVEKHGIEALFDAASCQPAGQVQLHNTPQFLIEADVASVRFARQFRLAGFNAYRTRWGQKPYESFSELTGDPVLAAELEKIYKDVDRVELLVGLYAENRDRKGTVLPRLLSLMVASDAFSHALTNPLLGANVYGPDGLTEFGHQEIEQFGRDKPSRLGGVRGVATLRRLVEDNCPKGRQLGRVSFELPGAVPLQ